MQSRYQIYFLFRAINILSIRSNFLFSFEHFFH